MTGPDTPLAVLVSGGLDSAILLGNAARTTAPVHPLDVRCGLRWEAAELHHLGRFLDAIRRPGLHPLTVLDQPVADLYGGHSSLTGRGVPAADSPDEAVYLPGRNVLLLSKALLWCHLRGVPAVAVGTLDANPFPDATPAFFDQFAAAVNRAVGGAVEVRRPFAGLEKAAVMKSGAGLPLELTFSCLGPVDGQHCGACNKCQERRTAFRRTGLPDTTAYRGPPRPAAG